MQTLEGTPWGPAKAASTSGCLLPCLGHSHIPWTPGQFGGPMAGPGQRTGSSSAISRPHGPACIPHVTRRWRSPAGLRAPGYHRTSPKRKRAQERGHLICR